MTGVRLCSISTSLTQCHFASMGQLRAWTQLDSCNNNKKTVHLFEHVMHHSKQLPSIILSNLPGTPLKCRYYY